MSEEFIDQHDFNQFIRDIAVCGVSFPADLDEVAYLIPTPATDLFCAVCPGFGIRNSKVEDPSGKVLLWNKAKKDIAYAKSVTATIDDWEEQYKLSIEDVMANWRKYVLR